jgi:putative FmdB family regulatory protein
MLFWFGANMPIYEYRCSACGCQKEFLQRVNDALHTKCPECGENALRKLVSAAGFQLKGTGWYATDFKNSGAKPAEKKTAEGASAKEGASKETTSKESSSKEGPSKETSKTDTSAAGS